jgi:hypothetical protein
VGLLTLRTCWTPTEHLTANDQERGPEMPKLLSKIEQFLTSGSTVKWE